jgi:YD repeat-containing protein
MNNTLTVKWLNDNSACSSGIDFAIKHKLIGFPFSLLPQIKCKEHVNYIAWVSNNSTNALEYDERGNVTRRTTPFNSSETLVYDDNNNVIRIVSHNATIQYWYDNNNNLIREITRYGIEILRTYDKNNNEIAYTMIGNGNRKVTDCRKKYDKNNNMVEIEYSDGFKNTYQYDINNNLIVKTRFDDIPEYYTYDHNNNLLAHTLDNEKLLEFFEYIYDDRGNITYKKSFDDYNDVSNNTLTTEQYMEYNDNNDVIYEKIITSKSSGEVSTIEKLYYPDGQLKEFEGVSYPFFEKI